MEAFPDKEQADTAKLNLGQIYHGTGRFPQAIEAYDSIGAKSAKYTEAKTKVGASYWEQSLALRRESSDSAADTAQAKAIDSLTV